MKRTTLGSVSALCLAALIGCLDTATSTDEPFIPPGVDAGGMGGGTMGGGGTVGGGGTMGGGGTVGGGGTMGGGLTDGGGIAGGGDGGVGDGSVADAGGGTPGGGSAVQAIIGSGANCSTYGLPMGGKCGGIYCGIDEALLTQAFTELPADRACVFPAAIACSGITARTVSSCARSTKSNPFNLGKTNAELRPLIQECVYKEATIKANVVPTCLKCYIDSAECSGDNCLDQCLLGDSAECDKCRLDKGCSRPVATCSGLPNPLPPL